MSPSLSFPVRFLSLLILLGIAAFFAASSSSKACSPATWCAWQRTFYAYNALDYPLPPYYTPRTPGCIRGDYACGQTYGAAGDGRCAAGGCNDPSQGGMMGFESVELERLGQVPNDMASMGLGPEGGGQRPSR
jgi:hypothetical protein